MTFRLLGAFDFEELSSVATIQLLGAFNSEEPLTLNIPLFYAANVLGYSDNYMLVNLMLTLISILY